MATIASRINEVADGVLAVVAQAQQVVIDQVSTAGARISEATADLDLPDGLPFADSIGSPAEFVEQGFAFAGRVLQVQKDFVLKLASAAEGMVTEPTQN